MGGTISVTQGDFILDLNGYTFTSSDFATPFDIGSGVKVKITDSGEDGKIVSNYAVAIDNEGDLTLEDGTITGKGGVINRETGYFQVYENGTVQSKSLPAIETTSDRVYLATIFGCCHNRAESATHRASFKDSSSRRASSAKTSIGGLSQLLPTAAGGD